MDISNLEAGTTYKNYKALCQVLGEETKTSNSKKAQFKEWERYFSFEKQGQKITITEIFDEPKEKDDLRLFGNNKNPHIEHIENLLIHLCVEQGGEKLTLSRTKLFRLLEMHNDNYIYGKKKQFKLSDFVNINHEEIRDFYTTTDDLLKRNLETALNSLDKKRLLQWKKIMTVCYVDTTVSKNVFHRIKVTKREEVNEYGETIVSFDPATPTNKLIYRPATEEEAIFIYEVEQSVLERYKCKEITDIYKIGKSQAFYKEVEEILLNQANIYRYFKSYEMLYSRVPMVKKWEEINNSIVTDDQIEWEKFKLNSAIVDKIEENANKRHEKAIEYLAFGEMGKSIDVRSSNEYIRNTKKLSDMLISRGAKRIEYND